MKPEEIAAAQANGISPVEFAVARDAIAVVVHPSNPIDGLTLQQNLRHLYGENHALAPDRR